MNPIEDGRYGEALAIYEIQLECTFKGHTRGSLAVSLTLARDVNRQAASCTRISEEKNLTENCPKHDREKNYTGYDKRNKLQRVWDAEAPWYS